MAYVAVAELPVGQWGDIIQQLVSNVANPISTEMMKEATLETIGYICQEIESDVLVPQSNQILTAIIHGMKGSSTSNHVRLAATSALYNSLEFTKGNFEIEVSIVQKVIRCVLVYDGSSMFGFFACTVGEKLHHGSGVRGNTVYEHASQSSCFTVSCENYVPVLSIHGAVHGSRALSYYPGGHEVRHR